MFNDFINGIKDELNVSTTENGAKGYLTTNKAIVDFNFKISSYRNKSENAIIVDFKKVYYEDPQLALKYIFYVRDIREGLGERRLFRICIKEIINQLDNRVFDWIAEYGRYDDLFVFFDTKLEDQMITYVYNQLINDMNNCIANKSVSLLAKWMPSIKTSSKESMMMAKKFINGFNKFNQEDKITSKDYRKTLSKLRSYIDVIEKKQCANEWDKINYSTVPSIANLKYKDAFMRHDKIRRTEYLESLERGEIKINSSVTFPHNIVSKYNIRNGKDITLEEMWKALPNYVNGNSNTIVVRDGSGSMTWSGNNDVKPIDIATALAIYFSERCEGVFKDKFITFSSKPELISFEKYKTLQDKLRLCSTYNDCSNTDLKKVFDLVLKTSVANKLTQEEIPTLLIMSDMEFDNACVENPDEKLFITIAKEFNQYGYKLPKLVFWNICSRTNTIPITQNELGVILVSGYSPAICKMILQEENDPYKTILNILNLDRYKQITLKNQ